jgi:voltage-gated potassium channel
MLVSRLLIATALVVMTVAIVYAGRAGYTDSTDHSVSLLDAVYYATVSLSSSQGEIQAESDEARLASAVVVTPLRVAFLLVLLSTTLEVLTIAVRDHVRARRWRRRMQGHSIVIGYGTTGRAAALALREAGVPGKRILVVDERPDRAAVASDDGLPTVTGDATLRRTLVAAAVDRAARVVVACERDEASVLAALTARRLNPAATLIAGVARAEHADLLREHGVDAVVTCAEASGRLLGVSAMSLATGRIVNDLLSPGTGLSLLERAVTEQDLTRTGMPGTETLIAVVRDGVPVWAGEPAVAALRTDDRLVVLRWAAGDRPANTAM